MVFNFRLATVYPDGTCLVDFYSGDFYEFSEVLSPSGFGQVADCLVDWSEA